MIVQAHKRKMKTYYTVAAEHQATMFPVAFTSYGSYYYDVIQFLKQMERTAVRAGNDFPDIEGSFTHKWISTIGFTIARAEAKYA